MGEPITMPVGKPTLGRVMNLLGEPVDGKGPVADDERLPIHRLPPPFLAKLQAAAQRGDA